MPIYAYHCVSCGNNFDLKQGFDAHTETPCPLCDDTARRRFVAPTVIYKGSGFYTTDYARKGASSSTTTPASTSDSKSETSTEPKSSPSKSESPASATDSA